MLHSLAKIVVLSYVKIWRVRNNCTLDSVEISIVLLENSFFISCCSCLEKYSVVDFIISLAFISLLKILGKFMHTLLYISFII